MTVDLVEPRLPDRRPSVAVRPGAPTLMDWFEEANAAASIAKSLAATPFIPASLRVIDKNGDFNERATTANIAAALLTGQELGLSPMASLRSIDIVNGTPALRAIALRGILQRYGHDIWLVEATNSRVIMSGRRAGSDKEQTITWTMDDAKSRGLAGKDNWRKQPRNMLMARATADVARLVASDAIIGLPYIAEELEDNEVGTPELAGADGQPAAPKTGRTAQRRNQPTPRPARTEPSSPVDEPPLDEPKTQQGPPSMASRVPAAQTDEGEKIPPGNPPASAGSPAEAGRGERDRSPLSPDEPDLDADEDLFGRRVTEKQLKALHAGLEDVGIKDRQDKLLKASGVLGREIFSLATLTLADATRVLNEIGLMKAQEPQTQEEPGE